MGDGFAEVDARKPSTFPKGAGKASDITQKTVKRNSTYLAHFETELILASVLCFLKSFQRKRGQISLRSR